MLTASFMLTAYQNLWTASTFTRTVSCKIQADESRLSATRRFPMSLPKSIIAVLAHFQPWFTAPTWKQVVTLLIGTLLARGRRTVAAALRQTGHQMDGHFSLFHQVLN